MMMENQDASPSHVDASRPSLGFPLGTALLLIMVFSLSGIFSCCYHWDKFRSFRHSLSVPPSPSKSNLQSTEASENRGAGLPVLMPGDDLPKFIAMPCPCQPPRPHQHTVVVTVDDKSPPPPPKPPQVPVPLYL